MASEGCGLRDLPGNEIYLGLQGNGCRQTPSRGSTRLTVPNRILPQNALLENEYTIVKKYQPPNEPIGPQLRLLPKCFLNFTYFCGFVLISFYLANISSVLMPRSGPLWRLFTFTLTHTLHTLLWAGPPGSRVQEQSPILHAKPAACCGHNRGADPARVCRLFLFGTGMSLPPSFPP